MRVQGEIRASLEDKESRETKETPAPQVSEDRLEIRELQDNRSVPL